MTSGTMVEQEVTYLVDTGDGIELGHGSPVDPDSPVHNAFATVETDSGAHENVEKWLAVMAEEEPLTRWNGAHLLQLAASVDAELVKKETDPAEVDRQIEEGLEAAGGSAAQFVNNFETMLPKGMRWQEFYQDYDILDAPLVDKEPDALDWVYQSDRYLNGTTRQLFEDVMRSIRSNDEIEPRRLQGLRDAYIEAPEQSREEARDKYLAYALPIYRDLRVLGYSHYDLSH